MADERHVFGLSPAARARFGDLLRSLRDWARDNQEVLGVAEMAAGGALIYGGIQSGAIALGTDVVLTTGAKIGSILGGTAGGLGGTALGGIGIAFGGTAIAVPAALVAVLGATAFSFAGFAIGDLVHKLIGTVDVAGLGGSIGLVGLGFSLLLDGARRVASSRAVRAALSQFKDGCIQLGRLARQAAQGTMSELGDWLEQVRRSPELASAMLGTVAGSATAASSVALLGSRALGAVGLTLGVASAPSWPVFLACGAAAAASIAAWHIAKRRPR
jgi:hypothetical protein